MHGPHFSAVHVRSGIAYPCSPLVIRVLPVDTCDHFASAQYLSSICDREQFRTTFHFQLGCRLRSPSSEFAPEQLQQHIHELQEDNQQMQSDHKSKFANITSLMNDLDKNINILTKDKKDTDAEIASLTAKNKQLVKTFHALQSERNKYEIQVNILTKVNQVSEEKISSLKAKLDNLDTINERTSISSSTLPLPEEIECSGNQEPPGTLSNPFTLDDSDVENDDGNLEFKPLAPLHTNEKPRKKKRASMVRQLDSCLESPKKLRSHSAWWRRGRMER